MNTYESEKINVLWNNCPMYKKDNKFYGFEPFFRDFVVMAYVNDNTKEIRPAHGYFLPVNYTKITFTLNTLKTPLPLIRSLYRGYKLNNN